MRPPLAYLFERFPSFTQTFCFREVRELAEQGLPPAIYAIRKTTDEPPQDYPPTFSERVFMLPDAAELTEWIRKGRADRSLPRPLRRTLENWTSKQDRHRVYEAAWLGPRLRRAGIRHVHAHFAGIAARTAFWLKRFFGIQYSFTGHANDLYCPEFHLPVTLSDLIREAALVITVSDHTRAELAGNHPAAANRIRKVYNGIDTRLWTPGTPPADRPPTLVAVGRLIEKKGFADLVRACALLHHRGTHLKCRIIGEGPMESELREGIAREGVTGIVELAGPRTQQEILTELRVATLFVLPCVHERDGGRDVLPTVLMEAMACGLPCVSTPVAGVPELVADRQTGLLVPERRPDLLADAIGFLLANPAQGKAFGAAGRAAAESTFDIRVTTRSLKHFLVRFGKVRPSPAALRKDPALWKTWILQLLGC